ncbi:hypothetical protein [Bacillus anthracis]|uniref:hypothetical protein n=1 Tax=Bacillus anthracis TaxID=1392 RepID=UPI00285271AA|nr:hypothetical protein [Bacillus anthracis]
MGITYTEFKERVKSREIAEFEECRIFMDDLSSLYDEEKDFVFFYPRNLFNDMETDFTFFLQDGYVTIQKKGENYQYKHYKCKLLSKELTKGRYENNDHTLKLKFDNGIELFFSSETDSNEAWTRYYSRSIIDLYKLI